MKTLLYKTLSLLSLPLTITACDNPVYQSNARAEVRTEANSTPKATPTPVQYSFDRFGEAINILCWDYGRIEETRAYDFDGDGDPDLVIRTNNNQVFIYENRITQHNQKQTSATAESYK